MGVNIVDILFQLVVFGLLVLFFVSLFKFVRRRTRNIESIRETLMRIEEKIDQINKQ